MFILVLLRYTLKGEKSIKFKLNCLYVTNHPMFHHLLRETPCTPSFFFYPRFMTVKWISPMPVLFIGLYSVKLEFLWSKPPFIRISRLSLTLVKTTPQSFCNISFFWNSFLNLVPINVYLCRLWLWFRNSTTSKHLSLVFVSVSNLIKFIMVQL